MKKLRTGLLITGNEVLSAKTTDTNSPFIGQHLDRLGIPICASMLCGDHSQDLLNCLTYLSSHCEVIFMTGGLGPTSDDLSAAVIAQFFSVPLVFNETAWKECIAWYSSQNRSEIPESNKKQALLPKDCRLLANPCGTASGFVTQGKVCGKTVTIYSMPGVPYEMEEMFESFILAELSSLSCLPVRSSWQIFYLGESAIQSAIQAEEQILQERFPECSISYRAHFGYVTYTVSLFPESEDQRSFYEDVLQSYIKKVNSTFKENILFQEDQTVSNFIVNKLKEQKCTLGLLEGSCFAALLKEFSQQENFTHVLKGAVSVPLQADESLLDLAKVQHEKWNSSVTLAEYGSLILGDLSDHQWILLFNKSDFPNYTSQITHLKKFSWSLVQESSNSIILMAKRNIGLRANRNSKQIRVSSFALCSLASFLSKA